MWTLATDRTMNQHSHQVPLSPLVRSIIERMPWNENRGGYVFARRGRKVSGVVTAKIALDKAMASNARAEGKDFKPWRVQDLRRTAATGMSEIGIVPDVVEAVLTNHVHKAGVAGDLAQYAAQKKIALERWADEVGLPRGR